MGPDDGQRWVRLVQGAGGMVTGRLVVGACGLVQLPIALAGLGTKGFGIWIALVGIVWSLGFLDLGIGSAFQNRLTRLLAVERHGEAVALVRRTAGILLIEALVVAAVALPLVLWGPWERWLGAGGGGLHLRASVAVVFAAVAANLPLSLFNRVAAAEQRMWIGGLATAAAAVLGVGGIALAATLRLPLSGFMLAGCILPVGPNVLVTLLYWLRPGWLRTPRATDGAGTEGLLREGLLFVTPQISGSFTGNFVPTLVIVSAGPVAAAAFGALQRIYTLILNLQFMALAPGWPAFTHAHATRDVPFARRTLRTLGIVTGLAFILPVLAVTPIVPWAVHHWLGSKAPPIPRGLLWSLALWTALQCCGTPLGVFLNGIGKPHSLSVLAPVTILASLALFALHLPVGGVVGVVAALALPYAFITLPVIAWCAHRALADWET